MRQSKVVSHLAHTYSWDSTKQIVIESMTTPLCDFLLPGGLRCEGTDGKPCDEAAEYTCEDIVGYRDPAHFSGAIYCGKRFCAECGEHGEVSMCAAHRAAWEAEMRAEYELEKRRLISGHQIPDGHSNRCSRWIGGNCDCVQAYIDEYDRREK